MTDSLENYLFCKKILSIYYQKLYTSSKNKLKKKILILEL